MDDVAILNSVILQIKTCLPTYTGDLGLNATFLSDMLDWIKGIEGDLMKASDKLPVPAHCLSPAGISIQEAIQVSRAAPL